MKIKTNQKAQTENGYTRIANEIVTEFSKLHLSGNEWQILWVVLRKTWGWNKKEDAISLTQFQELTKLSRPSVAEAIVKLVGKKVLLVNKSKSINVYSFNKLYQLWDSTKKVPKLVPKRVLVPKKSQLVGKTVELVPKKVPKLVPKKEHTKDNKDTITKDTIQKTHANRVSKYPSLNSLTVDDFNEIAKQYHVPVPFVLSRADDIRNWTEAKGKRYRNYKAALRDWVKRDALKIINKQNDSQNRYRVARIQE